MPVQRTYIALVGIVVAVVLVIAVVLARGRGTAVPTPTATAPTTAAAGEPTALPTLGAAFVSPVSPLPAQ